MPEPTPPGGADRRIDDPEPGEATRLLRRSLGGESGDEARLFELLFGELRAMAARAMGDERTEHTLQPTALLGEVWLKLFAGRATEFDDRNHFLAVAAQAMRQLLVDHARTRQRIKRGGEWGRVAIDVALDVALDEEAGDSNELDLVALDAALDELRAESPRQAQVVEMRFFAGLSVEEVAAALDVSERTIGREWRFARAWLLKRLDES